MEDNKEVCEKTNEDILQEKLKQVTQNITDAFTKVEERIKDMTKTIFNTFSSFFKRMNGELIIVYCEPYMIDKINKDLINNLTEKQYRQYLKYNDYFAIFISTNDKGYCNVLLNKTINGDKFIRQLEKYKIMYKLNKKEEDKDAKLV